MINKSLISDSDVDLAISARVATQITADVHYSPSFFAATQLQWTNKVQERKIQALVLGLSSI